MFIRFQSQNNKPSTVVIIEGYRDVNKVSRQRIVKTIGKVVDFRLMYPNKTDKEIIEILTNQYGLKRKVETIFYDLKEENSKDNIIYNYGYIVINKILNSLKLSLDNKVSSIIYNLISLRIIEPSSKLHSFTISNTLLGENVEYSIKDVYKVLDYLKDEKTNIIKSINSSILNRDLTYTFYDTTNFYFETDYTNKDDIRQKGVSKENRPLPIVQMGLLMDNNSIPIHYKLFKGNTNDHNTLTPIFNEYKEMFNLGKVILVADAGINSGSNLHYLKENNGYIVRCCINNNTPKEIKTLCLDEDGYIYNNDNTYKSKTSIIKRVIQYKENEIIKTETITEKVVCTWKKEYYDRDLEEHNIKKERILKLLNGKDKVTNIKQSNLSHYFVLDNKETRYEVDWSKFNNELKYSGYYSIITSELDLSEEEIINKYSGLLDIEECFKIKKHELKGRPVFVRTKEHIEGHFMVCFLSLVILRLLENKLNEKYPISKIREAIKSMIATKLDGQIYKLNGQTDLVQELLKCIGYYDELNKNYITIEKFLKIKQ